MKAHEFKSDIIYREIVSMANENNGVIDRDAVISKLSEKAIHVTPAVIESRIKYYLEESGSNKESNQKN